MTLLKYWQNMQSFNSLLPEREAERMSSALAGPSNVVGHHAPVYT